MCSCNKQNRFVQLDIWWVSTANESECELNTQRDIPHRAHHALFIFIIGSIKKWLTGEDGYSCSLLCSLLRGINVTSPGSLCLFMIDKIFAAILSVSTMIWKSLQMKPKRVNLEGLRTSMLGTATTKVVKKSWGLELISRPLAKFCWMKCWNCLLIKPFNITRQPSNSVQQNRMDVEANVEVVC